VQEGVGKAKNVGLARTIHIRCTYGIFGRKLFGREITIYMVIYDVFIRF
jgi:hypothetical protein